MARLHNRKNNPCTNPNCGNTLYTSDRDWMDDGSGLKAVWRCSNCGELSERKTRSRRSNNRRALDLIQSIKTEWADTDAALQSLVDAGIPSGCLLVHSSTWNYHLDCLRGSYLKPKQKHLTNWEIQYHAAKARIDLIEAQAFLRSHGLRVSSEA